MMFFFSSVRTNTNNRDYLLWGLLYLIAHGGILLIPNAIFWDDWLLYRMEPGVVFDTFRQAGSLFNISGYLHVSLLAIGPWIYKALTFFLMFSSGLLLNLILKRYVLLSTEIRFFIVLLFLILPFNIARVALIDFPYTLRYFLFFAGWLLMDRYRVLALALFFISFNTNSLLVFYALPILDIFYRNGSLSSIKSTIKFGIARLDFILLPFVYFLIKVFFFPPSGAYVGYNENYSINNIIESSITQKNDFFNLFTVLAHPNYVGIKLILIFSILSFLMIRKKLFDGCGHKNISWKLLVFGIVAFFLGAFPYWLIGQSPIFYDWQSRHQLLLPLGGAMMIVGVLSFIGCLGVYEKNNSIIARIRRFINISAISIIIGTSLAFSVSCYAGFYVDWQKQKQLVKLFSENLDIQRARLIIIEDRTEDINGLKRPFRFYEWNGLMEMVFGDEKRFVVPRRDFNSFMSGKFDKCFQKQYKAADFDKDNKTPPVFVEINMANPSHLMEIINLKAAPDLRISVSQIDLTTFREIRE